MQNSIGSINKWLDFVSNISPTVVLLERRGTYGCSSRGGFFFAIVVASDIFTGSRKLLLIGAEGKSLICSCNSFRPSDEVGDREGST